MSQTYSKTVTKPPTAYILIGACVLVFLLQYTAPRSPVWTSLALWPFESGRFEIWQLVSYGFMHGSFNHLFFNMFALWMFGLQIEKVWGSKRFAVYYFICIIGAGVSQMIVQQMAGSMVPTIGASGAVFGLLLAYGVMFPNNRIFLIFLPIPIKAKWFVLIYGAFELYFGLSHTMPGVAHFAHLGGLFFGGALMMSWGWRPGMTWHR